MKKSFILIFFILLTTSCSKHNKLQETNSIQDTSSIQENNQTIEIENNEQYSNINAGKLDDFKDILQIKIGSQKSNIQKLLEDYEINEEDSDENTIAYTIFDGYNFFLEENDEDDDINEEISLFCTFDENDLLINYSFSIMYTISDELFNKTAYNNYIKLQNFITKYYKAPTETFFTREKQPPFICIWNKKNEKILLDLDSVGLFGYRTTVYSIFKIKN